ncbi:hypothetical protein DAEQUDRAFT_762623 [Daedalea quercina L-15889]|uniref:Uncharacterized protein n=1 Tax=Daedalea quercina L-15889 TaxID=1314783 RepID=A0A165T1Z7_9APHY|nr:hypothetical protein DAEQUDRAFT_762623 [Daedalea quercina L-15889]
MSLLLPQVYASNFTFSYGNASQCEDFNISWTGGNAPYELTIVTTDVPKTYSIPSSSYSNGQGSYQIQLALNASSQFVAVMSDASGFGSGGVSDMITVGSGSSSCDRSLQAADFTFQANSALNQCRYFAFTDYTGATQPVTITGVIPGGETFILTATSDEVDWQVDVAAGTTLLFFMADSKGHSGGSTQWETVIQSGDSSCLTGAYPSSLSAHPSGTATTSTGAATNTVASNVATSSTPTGAIVGGIVGGVVGLGLIAAAIFVYLRKERQKRRYGQSGAFAYRGTRPKHDEIDPTDSTDDVPPPDVVQPFPYYNPSATGSASSPAQQSFAGNSAVSLMRPISYAESQGYAGFVGHSRNTSLVDGGSAFTGSPGARESGVSGSQSQSQSPSTVSSAARRKAAMAGVTPYQPNPPRFILHTDAEDVVELPPQYSSLRAPSALTETTDADSRRASGSGSSAPRMSYPPPPIVVPPASAAIDAARPPSSIMEEDYSHPGLQEPMAPSSARSPGPVPPYSPTS